MRGENRKESKGTERREEKGESRERREERQERGRKNNDGERECGMKVEISVKEKTTELINIFHFSLILSVIAVFIYHS